MDAIENAAVMAKHHNLRRTAAIARCGILHAASQTLTRSFSGPIGCYRSRSRLPRVIISCCSAYSFSVCSFSSPPCSIIPSYCCYEVVFFSQ